MRNLVVERPAKVAAHFERILRMRLGNTVRGKRTFNHRVSRSREGLRHNEGHRQMVSNRYLKEKKTVHHKLPTIDVKVLGTAFLDMDFSRQTRACVTARINGTAAEKPVTLLNLNGMAVDQNNSNSG